MNIYTITLNPAYDVHCGMRSLLLGKENLVTKESRIAGGKGVNISRALTVFGVPNTALIVLGEENDRAFLSDLEEMRMKVKKISVPGRIRENYTFHPETGEETRISFPGAPIGEEILDVVAAELSVREGDFVTLTGSIPRGISPERITDFLLKLRDRGAKLIVDSGNYPLSEIRKVHPYLIKPNGEEVARMVGNEIGSAQEAVAYTDFLATYAENVMVSLGAEGAVLLKPKKSLCAKPPKISAVSTVGAGDSMIAGFIKAKKEGKSEADCLSYAVAFGSAACLREGTLPPLQDDVAWILPQIKVRSI